MGAPLRILLSALEPSGDLQAAALARALRQRAPDLELVGVGGEHLRAAGVPLLLEGHTWSVIGPTEAVFRLPDILLALPRYKRMLVAARPDLSVFIDSPAVHMRLARLCRRHGLRSAYYFPPSAWTTSSRRLRQIHQRVDAVIPTFAFSARAYEREGLPVAYYGHPLVDLFTPPPDREQARAELGLAPGRYVTLLPGSRTQEVRLLLPLLLEVARRLRARHADLRFLVPCANAALERRIRRVAGGEPGVLLLSGQAGRAMAVSDLALGASGSVSLEAALVGVPLVLLYKLNRVDMMLARLLASLGLLRVRRFALPNLVLDRDVCPELLQEEASPQRIEAEALALLEDQEARRAMQADLARVRAALGRPGVIPRVAALVHHLASGCDLARARARVEEEFAAVQVAD
ncbi:MAG TPA: lipid-A-disaccharide synthase [Candidatus Nitrosotenuis sp.]|jgi:lipid-A-disaccharide synthase|nr:lipid-A-disaccharide synthase [Candidatus Nitrosotenuis sp.]